MKPANFWNRFVPQKKTSIFRDEERAAKLDSLYDEIDSLMEPVIEFYKILEKEEKKLSVEALRDELKGAVLKQKRMLATHPREVPKPMQFLLDDNNYDPAKIAEIPKIFSQLLLEMEIALDRQPPGLNRYSRLQDKVTEFSRGKDKINELARSTAYGAAR